MRVHGVVGVDRVRGDLYDPPGDGMGGKWSEDTSWKEGTAPQAGDAVIIDATETAAKGIIIEATKADIDFLETTGVGDIVFANIGPNARNPVLQVTVGPDERATYSGVITNDVTSDYNSGYLVKKGEGHLQLTHDRGNYHLAISLQVDEGILQLPSVDNTYRNQHYARFIVNSPGVLWALTSTENNSARAYLHDGIAGDGMVTNPSPKYATTLQCEASKTNQRTFSGVLAGNLRVQVDKNAGQIFTRRENPTTGTHTLDGGAELGLVSIGGTTGDKSNIGSVGKGAFTLGNNTTVRYLGSGEVSYATFNAAKELQRFTLNGGPNGGYEHCGKVDFSTATNVVAALVLDGTNRTACTLASGLVKGTKVESMRLVKRGSGTWNAQENAGTTLDGIVAVEDGTLTFDTLSEVGYPCALGWATALRDDAGAVDYAVLLGTASTTGMLASAASCSVGACTRPIALLGDGRLSSGTASLSWMGVKAVAAGEHTLTLDGSAANAVLYDVRDGSGQVAIAKEGSGNWTLSGTLAFTGGIDVRGGSLTISSATNYYRYYRLNLKERALTNPWNPSESSGETFCDISRLGLFNAAGVGQAAGTVTNMLACGNPLALQPGETTLYSRRPNMDYSKITYSAGSPETLFWNATGGNYWWRFTDMSNEAREDRAVAPWIDKPESWMSVVVRLPDGAEPVVSYDIGDRWKYDHKYAKYLFQTWSLDASVDGASWQEISNVISNMPSCSNHNYWRRANVSLGSKTNTAGWPIVPGIIPESTLVSGLDRISVAAGATLTSDTRVTVRKIVVEAAGGGAVSGFRLADDGVIDVVGVPAKGAFEVALDLSQIELPDGVPILVNGQEDRREVVLSADRKSIKGTPPGLMILVK